MALEIKLNQKLSQSLVMTPQLQQAIKLLQLGRQDYLEVLEKELLENPVLEDAREEDFSRESLEDRANVNENSTEPTELSGPALTDDHDVNSEIITGDKELTVRTSVLGDDMEAYSDYSRTKGATPSTCQDDDRRFWENTASVGDGLTSHLMWQLRTSDLTASEKEIAVQIVGNLDRNGYLTCSVEEIFETSEKTVEDIEQVLSFVQTLDPSGIAARNLRECLLIQLEQLGRRDTLSWKIVSDYLSEVENRRFETIAKKEGLELETVYDAVKEIQRLEPRPGRPYADETPIYITPDVFVKKVGEDYVVSLNDTGMPRLRMNEGYQSLLNGSLKTGNGQEREYLQERLRQAAWLIKSIHQRQQTILKVAESIIKYQRDFLEQGVQALRPLILRDIAQDVGMHESTVSRVTTNKYVHTPQGVFELKFFFNTGIKSGGGEVASESVKERIREMITKENTKRPLSDQEIAEKLKTEGIDIARRTVAKYREMMSILSSSRRKRIF